MRKFVLAAVLVLVASGAQAATLNVVGGQLLGASGVIVDGSLYNVEFLDGTCIALYNGCDDVSDFTFQTEAAAVLASQALLDQVFLDGVLGDFDTEANLTNGCAEPSECSSFTPYKLLPPGTHVEVASTINFDDISFTDLLVHGHGNSQGATDDLHNSPYNGYAVWSFAVIPEPGTAVLMGLGLLGLSVRKRRDG